jgi:NADH-quinone oxidoreductase subunit J
VELLAFVLASGVALAGAAFVVFHRNPIICALALVAHLLCVAVLFLTLGAQFIAGLQVIIYAGAIMVLIVFVIMLLALPRESPLIRSGLGQILFAAIGGLALLAAIARGVTRILPGHRGPAEVGEEFGHAAWLARTLFTDYFYPFELISLVLIAAMAGAILLAKREI